MAFLGLVEGFFGFELLPQRNTPQVRYPLLPSDDSVLSDIMDRNLNGQGLGITRRDFFWIINTSINMKSEDPFKATMIHLSPAR